MAQESAYPTTRFHNSRVKSPRPRSQGIDHVKRRQRKGNRISKVQTNPPSALLTIFAPSCRLKFVFVKARNAHVKEGLQRAYSSELDVPQGQLNVFCVSNTTYEKYSRKGKTEFVQDSGIPAVRQFCHSITADAQLRHARQVLQCELAGRLNSLILWASSLHSHVAIQADQSYEPIEQALLRIAFNVCL